MRWTGNGLADGTLIDSTNRNTSGNGDPVIYSVAGTGSGALLTGGDGFDMWGDGTRVLRLDGSFTAAAACKAQSTFTVREATASSDNHIIMTPRDGSGNRVMSVRYNRAGTLSLLNAAGTVVVTLPTAFVLTHRYLIDVITALAASPTTSNGRIVFRVTAITDPSWNGGQPYFYESGYTVNVSTAQPAQVQFGKAAQGPAISETNPQRLERLGWDRITDDLTVKTSRSDIEPYFMDNPWAGVGTNINLLDSLAITDSGSPQVATYGATDNNGLGIVDSTQLEQIKSLADSSFNTDWVETVVTRVQVLQELANATDAVVAATGMPRDVADAVSMTDAVTTTSGREVAVSDSITGTDALSLSASGASTTADNATVSDAVASAADRSRLINDTLGVTDSASLGSSYGPVPADSGSLSDVVSTVGEADRQAPDVLGMTDGVTFTLSRVATVSDLLALTDAAMPEAAGAGSASAADGLGATDAVQTTFERHRVLGDGIDASDVAAVQRVAYIALVDQLAATDGAMSASPNQVRELWDAISASDVVIAEMGLVTPELTAQRRLTDQFIRRFPVTIVLTPRGRQQTPAGGYTYAEQSPRAPQLMTLIEPGGPTRPTVTVDGVERVVDYVLLGSWDAQLGTDDVFEHAGARWEVIQIQHDNGWEQRALVERHG